MRPALLVIFDGLSWGDPDHPCNAVARADTPCLDRLRRECPDTELLNNGEHVGLPPGQMGNSEVGHMNIGAGRVVLQDFMRINHDIEEGRFGENDAYQAAFAHVKRTGGRLHLMGLLGPGGIHAHESHFGAALKAAAKAGIEQVFVHPVGDGRDTPPRSALGFLDTLQAQIDDAGVGRIASFTGRYFAMDRDKRWERTAKAFRLYARGEGHEAPDAKAAVEAAYARGENDEFVEPTLIDPEGVVRDGDACVWLNFRPDRSRQITRAFMDPDLDATCGPEHADDAKAMLGARPRDLLWVCTAQYDDAFAGMPGVRIAYPPARVEGTLAEHIAEHGLKQFHTAETEKYAHVTYFLNGGRERPFEGEERHLVPSPKVATYDLKPEMNAGQLTDDLLHALGSGDHDLLVVNFANPDMVGHTGVLDATIKAVEFVDNCLNRLVTVATELGYLTLITSDHGNAEDMCKLNDDGTPGDPITKHSMYPSPLIAVNAGDVRLRDGGALCNVAPTLCDLMGVPPRDGWVDSLVERI